MNLRKDHYRETHRLRPRNRRRREIVKLGPSEKGPTHRAPTLWTWRRATRAGLPTGAAMLAADEPPGPPSYDAFPQGAEDLQRKVRDEPPAVRVAAASSALHPTSLLLSLPPSAGEDDDEQPAAVCQSCRRLLCPTSLPRRSAVEFSYPSCCSAQTQI